MTICERLPLNSLHVRGLDDERAFVLAESLSLVGNLSGNSDFKRHWLKNVFSEGLTCSGRSE